MIRDYCTRVRQRLADALAVDSTPTIDVQRISDRPDSILVFRIPDGYDEEEADEFIEFATSMGDRFASNVLVLPEDIDISEVAE